MGLTEPLANWDTLHYTTLHYITLHYIALLHCITLHYITVGTGSCLNFRPEFVLPWTAAHQEPRKVTSTLAAVTSQYVSQKC